MKKVIKKKDPASFRDPSGYIFWQNNELFRQVNIGYKDNYDLLINSGLYEALVKENLLIIHKEVGLKYKKTDKAYRVIKPKMVPFISYPYEWCFSQLKDASLATLRIQRIALQFGMTLKDASAFNIQLYKGKSVLIDTLSFEKYEENQPWVAYKQFCEHFLAPLALMSYVDLRMSCLLRTFLHGVPLDLATVLLPIRARFNPFLLTHIFLHATSQKRFDDKSLAKIKPKFSKKAFQMLIDSLTEGIEKLGYKLKKSKWSNYYQESNYSSQAFAHKKKIVADFLDKVGPGIVWDLGANTGEFSQIAVRRSMTTIAFDNDPVAVEMNYRRCQKEKEKKLLPLVMDIVNPSPGVGWQNKERKSLIKRGPADIVFALALIHHLAISNNLPFERIVSFLKEIGKFFIVEFISKKDSQVKRMLSTRKNIFSNYNQMAFEDEFNRHFKIVEKVIIRDSNRILYLFKKKS